MMTPSDIDRITSFEAERDQFLRNCATARARFSKSVSRPFRHASPQTDQHIETPVDVKGRHNGGED